MKRLGGIILTFVVCIMLLFTACGEEQNDISKVENTKNGSQKSESKENTDSVGGDIVSDDRIDKEGSAENTADTILGNTPGNLANGGWIDKDGEWLYCSVFGGVMFKCKEDGSEKEKVWSGTDVFLLSINVVDDYIYFVGDEGLSVVKKDGTEYQLLINDVTHGMSYSSVYVVDDWICWGDKYRVKIGGTEVEQLSESESKIQYGSSCEIEHGDRVYYIDSETKYICKKSKDGSEVQSLLEEETSRINVSGDWIYYLPHQGGIWKININGEEKTRLYADPENIINGDILVFDEWIYFYDWNWDLYRIRTDGKIYERIVDTNYGRL